MEENSPKYDYPDCVDKDNIYSNDNGVNRIVLKIPLKDKDKDKESIVVILKNPSKANISKSDKTINNVINYIVANKSKYTALNNVGEIIILNLIPIYATKPSALKPLGVTIIDCDNLKAIDDITKKHNNVIVAWGNITLLTKEYNVLKYLTLCILKRNKNKLFSVGNLTKKGNPKHGQVWKMKDALIPRRISPSFILF